MLSFYADVTLVSGDDERPRVDWSLAGEDTLVLRRAVQGDHVEPLLGRDGVGGGEGPRRDSHRLAQRGVV